MTFPRLLASSALMMFALWGCGKTETPPPAAESKPAEQPAATGGEVVVKIGVAAPLTGPQSHYGKGIENAVRLAAEDATAAALEIGGQKVKFEVLAEDDQADPKTATSVAQKLVDAKVNGVVGHMNSGAGIPASKIYMEAGIPQISASMTAVAYTAQGYPTTFRVMANDAQQGKVLGEYATQKWGAKKVVLIDDRTAYGQGLADEVEKAVKASGGKIAAREFTTDKAQDFNAILTSAKGKSPDLIFFGGMDPQAGPMVRQLKDLGLSAKYLGGDGIFSPKFIELAGKTAEGSKASSPGLPLEKMPGGTAFKERYEAKFGQIQLYEPFAYDATNILIDAMKRAGSTDPAKYLAEMPKTNFTGVIGTVSFDEKGDIKNGPVSVYEVKDGKWEAIETIGG
ncbi:MAG: branched-chain amino acid ABC transporter substrate-binding protein [Pseudomonadota bacterium]|nr:branched-chain amino acid ABC transporter substrate-binding protein [Pseudomonadota bacterium]